MDLYIGGKLKLEGTVMVRSGNALQFTGKETKGTPLSMLGFNLEDTITVGATPRDPADVDKAFNEDSVVAFDAVLSRFRHCHLCITFH